MCRWVQQFRGIVAPFGNLLVARRSNPAAV
jgi:hypothetical protein